MSRDIVLPRRKGFKNLTGQVFGRLTAIAYAGSSAKDKESEWICRCECGTIKTIRGRSLLTGLTKSCGCLRVDVSRSLLSSTRGEQRSHYKHGKHKDPAYWIWTGMRYRCHCKTAKRYHRYGERGIRICDEWSDPAVFVAWAYANGYRPGLTIDRINNDGNYEPDNCQWLTKSDHRAKQLVDAEKAAKAFKKRAAKASKKARKLF